MQDNQTKPIDHDWKEHYLDFPAVRAIRRTGCALWAAVGASLMMLFVTIPLFLWAIPRLYTGNTSTQTFYFLSVTGLCLCFGGVLAVLLSLGRESQIQRDPGLGMLAGIALWGIGALLLGFDGIFAAYLLGIVTLAMGVVLCCRAFRALWAMLPLILRFALHADAEDAPPELQEAVRRGTLPLRRDKRTGLVRKLLCALSAAALGVLLVRLMPERFRLALLIVQLIALAVLTRCVLRLPMDGRTREKLLRCLSDPSKYNEDSALHAQLSTLLLEKHHRRWLIRGLIAVLRMLYPHRLLNAEAIRMDNENPLIFLANHGNLYGPVACMLHIPAFVRPWVISNIMTDLEETTAYLYKYNFEHAGYLPKRLRMPVAKTVARLSHWAMTSLESVPVFRDHPSQLRKTFRSAVDAMSCGEAMLIFPENPNAIAQDKGYEHEGIGPLFSGFAMLAPIYYNRTGKCCRFLPLYADQKTHTLKFGTEVAYNPDTPPIEERDRLVHEIETQLHRLAEGT